MTRIVWSHIEKGAIFARMEQVFRHRPNISRKDALREAQTVLNASRWIKVTDQRVFNYKDRIDIARQKALQESKKTFREALGVPAPTLAPTPAPEREGSTLDQLAEAFERLLDIMADAVASKVAAKMQPTMHRDDLLRHVDEQFEAEFAKYPRPRHDPRPIPHATGHALPGVLVIGLLPNQTYSTGVSRGDRLDLTFLTAEEAVSRPKLTRAHTVLMTKFISHAVQDKYRKATNLHFCNGGIVELWKILDSITPPVL